MVPIEKEGLYPPPGEFISSDAKTWNGPAPKPQASYVPKPYEQMTYPGQRVQIDVKVVPLNCLADRSQRFFQYTAIDEFTRLRFLGAYPEQSTYSSADFLKKQLPGLSIMG